MSGIGKHRIIDLLNLVGSVVPSLVDKMRVARDRINLATNLLKFVVLAGKVLKLRRADKREVGGVEEKDAPLAEHVLLADGMKLAVLIRLNGEVANLFVDHRHKFSLLKNIFDSDYRLDHKAFDFNRQ